MQKIEIRVLNPNRKFQRKVFVEGCEELIRVISVEECLVSIENGKDRVKIEQISEDMACTLQKVSKSVEVQVKEFKTTNENMITRVFFLIGNL